MEEQKDMSLDFPVFPMFPHWLPLFFLLLDSYVHAENIYPSNRCSHFLGQISICRRTISNKVGTHNKDAIIRELLILFITDLPKSFVEKNKMMTKDSPRSYRIHGFHYWLENFN
uniref:Uncharacterized protein n=1 Tax=Onchocerca volvulus TaxID=6282 RepID=A0A8R1XZD0_ONCVO